MKTVGHKKCQELAELDLKDVERIKSYTSKRRIMSCEYSLTTLFMWKQMYNPHLYFNENYMIIFEHYEGECYALMPLCEEAYFVESFEKTVELFEKMDETFEMYCVDEAYGKAIEEVYGHIYWVKDDRNLSDYIYDGEAMRTLKGKKLRKKKNHINAFKRMNEGRYLFTLLDIEDKDEILEYLARWC